jgi:hypothetical protein
MNTRWTNLDTRQNKRILAAAIAVLVVIWTAPAHAQGVSHPRGGPPGSWRIISSTDAGFKADHDGIVVAGPFDDFRRIKFKVTGAPLNLQRLVVTYENGVPDKIDVRNNIPEGGESRQIDLAGAGKRRIRRIDFWYDTKGFLKGKAHVTVFGMK